MHGTSPKKRDTKKKSIQKHGNATQEKIDQREKQIEAYLKINFEQMLNEKTILKERPDNFSIPEAVQKMGETFRQNMKSDREAYLRDLIVRLSNTYQECVDIRNQYEEAKRGAGMSAIDVSKENEKLQSEIDVLEEKYKKLQEEKANKEQQFKAQLGAKKQTLRTINQSIEDLQHTHQQLVKKMDALKSTMLKIRGGQKRMIKQVKTMILNEVEKVIDSNQQKEKELHEQKIQRLDAQISAEKSEQRRLERQCQMALDAIYSTIPQEMNFARIGVNELPDHVNDIKELINQTIEVRKDNAIKKLRKEVAEAIPGIDDRKKKNARDLSRKENKEKDYLKKN